MPPSAYTASLSLNSGLGRRVDPREVHAGHCSVDRRTSAQGLLRRSPNSASVQVSLQEASPQAKSHKRATGLPKRLSTFSNQDLPSASRSPQRRSATGVTETTAQHSGVQRPPPPLSVLKPGGRPGGQTPWKAWERGGRAAPAHGRSRDPRGCRSSAVGNRGAQLLSSQQCPLLIHPRLVRSPGGSFGLRQTGGHELSCGSGHGTNRTGRVCFSVPWRSRRHPEGLSCSVLRRKRGGGGDQDW